MMPICWALLADAGVAKADLGLAFAFAIFFTFAFALLLSTALPFLALVDLFQVTDGEFQVHLCFRLLKLIRNRFGFEYVAGESIGQRIVGHHQHLLQRLVIEHSFIAQFRQYAVVGEVDQLLDEGAAKGEL